MDESPAYPDVLPKGVLCPKCGYDMGGLAAGVCPECGTTYESANFEVLSSSQIRLLRRARFQNAIHITALVAAAFMFGVMRMIDPPWFPDGLGPLNPLILVILSVVIVLILSSRRGKVQTHLMRAVLVQRLWIAHLPWMTLAAGAIVHHFVGPSSTIAVQVAVICAVVLSLPMTLIAVRGGIRKGGLQLTRKERSDLRTLVILGWVFSNFSCIGMIHSVEFL